jgi:uncharacterized protein
MKTENIILGAVFLIIISGNVYAASFDCTKATSEVEKILCRNAELSRLDESLNKAYVKALDQTLFKKRMIKSQRQWLKNERDACKNAECMKKAYKTRIKELDFLSSQITIYSSEECNHPVVNLARFKPMSEPLKAIVAMYALQIGSCCEGSADDLRCKLTSSLGLGPQCSKEQISLVRKWFRNGIPQMDEGYGEWNYKEAHKPGRLEGICYNMPEGAREQQGWETINVRTRKNFVFVDAVNYWTQTADGPSGYKGYSTVYRIAKDRIITVSHKKVLDKKDENQ